MCWERCRFTQLWRATVRALNAGRWAAVHDRRAACSTQECGINNPFVPVVPRVTALFTELTTIRTALGDYEAAQINNKTGFRGPMTNRKSLRDDTLEAPVILFFTTLPDGSRRVSRLRV